MVERLPQRRAVSTHRLVGADGVDLSSEHDGGEDEEEEALKAQEDEEDNGRWRREGAALWGRRGEGEWRRMVGKEIGIGGEANG